MLEYLGYLASLIVLLSLLMSSIKKLRWISLLGASLFATYGFLIGSLPVGFMNIGIVLINVYYLLKMYTAKDYFSLLPIQKNTQYFKYFLDYYKKDMESFVDTSVVDIEKSEISFYILRNIVPAGIFVTTKYDDSTLKIELDYVVPAYRDFKMGNFIFSQQKELFLSKGYTRLISFTESEVHEKYLLKMGFSESNKENIKCFVKEL
ncbi:MAG: hypothetical protein QM489_03575 [Candidatus Izemoplasma sp.]